jgi:hypothetical protein
MEKLLHLKLFQVLSVIFLLLITSLSCGRTPQENINPALTSAAATIEGGSFNSSSTPTNTPAQTQIPSITPKPEPCKAESKVNSVNLRNSPSGGIIGCCLAAGEDVEIQKVDEKGEWVLIKGIDRPSHQGWVKLSLLNITGDCDLVSVPQQ